MARFDRVGAYSQHPVGHFRESSIFVDSRQIRSSDGGPRALGFVRGFVGRSSSSRDENAAENQDAAGYLFDANALTQKYGGQDDDQDGDQELEAGYPGRPEASDAVHQQGVA